MAEPFFRVERLTRRFGGLLAVNDVTFELRRDQIVGLIGPNGAGKTTLLRVITRLLRAEGGKVSLNEERRRSLSVGHGGNRVITWPCQETVPCRPPAIAAHVRAH